MFVSCLVYLMFSVITPLGYLQALYPRLNPMPEGYKDIKGLFNFRNIATPNLSLRFAVSIGG